MHIYRNPLQVQQRELNSTQILRYLGTDLGIRDHTVPVRSFRLPLTQGEYLRLLTFL